MLHTAAELSGLFAANAHLQCSRCRLKYSVNELIPWLTHVPAVLLTLDTGHWAECAVTSLHPCWLALTVGLTASSGTCPCRAAGPCWWTGQPLLCPQPSGSMMTRHYQYLWCLYPREPSAWQTKAQLGYVKSPSPSGGCQACVRGRPVVSGTGASRTVRSNPALCHSVWSAPRTASIENVGYWFFYVARIKQLVNGSWFYIADIKPTCLYSNRYLFVGSKISGQKWQPHILCKTTLFFASRLMPLVRLTTMRTCTEGDTCKNANNNPLFSQDLSHSILNNVCGRY